jgi:hypothetical protein
MRELTHRYLNILNNYINDYALNGEKVDKPTLEEMKAITFMVGFVEKVMESLPKITNDQS